MKAILFATALSLIATQALAANPKKHEVQKIVNQSLTLNAIKKSVAKDYMVPHCSTYKVSEYSEGVVKATALCTYTDSYGDSTGVNIDVEGSFYDDSKLILTKVEFVFAG